MPVWEYDEDIFYNCPLKFILPTVIEWYEMYKYEQEFGTDIKYHDRNNKYIEALNVYNNYYIYWLEEKRPHKTDYLKRLKHG